MSGELDRLAAEVEQDVTVIESAITLIDGLATQLVDHSGDPAAILRIADNLRGEREKLAAAVAKNTPADPEMPTKPVDTPPAVEG